MKTRLEHGLAYLLRAGALIDLQSLDLRLPDLP
jgi:hypothetical protein